MRVVYIDFSAPKSLVIRVSLYLLVQGGNFHMGDVFSAFKRTEESLSVFLAQGLK